jgi:LuxR family transcriptional regulator, maltose regulon positive regulatory protein
MAFALAREDQVRPSPRLAEPLSQSEVRVLCYLPTNLSAREVARELSASLNTVLSASRLPSR